MKSQSPIFLREGGESSGIMILSPKLVKFQSLFYLRRRFLDCDPGEIPKSQSSGAGEILGLCLS